MSDTKGKFAIGALIGAATGFAAGILTAPKSGKETVAELKVKTLRAKKEATKKADEIIANANDAVEKTKDKVQDVSNDAKEKVIDFKDRTERAAEGAKKGFFSNK
jgi:gas vesicle protein